MPLLPDVTEIQEALLVAVQEHALFVVTVKLPLLGEVGTLRLEGESVYTQPPPAWVIVKRSPPITIPASRSALM